MTPQEKSRWAMTALQNPILHEAFGVLEQNLNVAWKSSHPDHWKEREAIYAKLQALMDVKAQLQNFIDTAALDSTATR